MVTIDSIRKPVLADLAAFDEVARGNFNAEGELLQEMLVHVLSSRGKGIRPVLTMLSAAINSPHEQIDGDGRRCSKRTYLAAMLVEMIHTSSLIHDDVLDSSDTRRGRPSVNAMWQSNNAVILGDYILARTLSIGMASAQYDLVSHLGAAIATLCEGEVLQNQHAERLDTTREDYLSIIHRKTASLLGLSASLGAMSVGADRRAVERMRRFGEALGMAFQIQDDILDYRRTADTGKPSNNDLREGKITLPLIEILERCDEAERSRIMELVRRCRDDQSAVDAVQAEVDARGGERLAAVTMRRYLERGMHYLSEYAESDCLSALLDLCAYVTERNR